MLPKVIYLTREDAIRKGIQQGVFTATERSLAEEYLMLKEEIESIHSEIVSLRSQIAELYHANGDSDRINILNRKICIANERTEQVLELISQMEALPSLAKVLKYAKEMSDAEQLRRTEERMAEYRKEQEERLSKAIASRMKARSEQIETAQDLRSYISGSGKKPEKYIRQEIEKLSKQIVTNKSEIADLGFSLFGKKARRKKELEKETIALEGKKRNFEVLLRTNTIEEASSILLRNMHL